jgi:hypothetical protein
MRAFCVTRAEKTKLATLLQIGREQFTIRVGHLVDLDAELPFPLRALARPIGAYYRHHGFDRSLRQVYFHKQHSPDLRQLGFRETCANEREAQAKLADRLAVTSRWRGV